MYMPMFGEQLEVYEAPQLTLHINMSVVPRLLADIEEWTYSIRWTLVSWGFTWINTHGLTPTLAYFDIVPRTKSQKKFSFAFVDIGNALIIFASTQSACVQTRFRCTNIYVYKWITVSKLPSSRKRGVYEFKVYSKSICITGVLSVIGRKLVAPTKMIRHELKRKRLPTF